MKKSFMLALVAILAFAGSASAQNSASANANSHSRVISPVRITNCGNLSFGNIIGSTAGGTVTIPNTGGAATYSDQNNMKPGTQVGVVSAACFCATGATNFYFTIGPVAGTVVTITGPACSGTGCDNTMDVTLSGAGSFTSPAGSVALSSSQFPSPDSDPSDPDLDEEDSETGQICWKVGGTIAVGPTNNSTFQLLGTYTGSWNETISYN